MKTKLLKAVDNFKSRKITVIGDLMLDHFIAGNVERISPEAPVPVIIIDKEFFVPGGAGNVASNIVSLGAQTTILGCIGDDEAGKILLSELFRQKIDTGAILKYSRKPTTQKTRIIGGNQQIARIDRECTVEINKNAAKKVINSALSIIRESDGVVISDYGKGFVTKELARNIIKIAKKYKKPIIADTKPAHAPYYNGVTVLTPNHKEAEVIANTSNVKDAGYHIMKRLNSSVLITQGTAGMTLFEKNRIKYFKAHAKEVYDVVGAGDTVAAALSLGLASGLNLRDSTYLANVAAGIVVGKRGTAVVMPKELKSAISH